MAQPKKIAVSYVTKAGRAKTVKGTEAQVRAALRRDEGFIESSSITWSDRLPWEAKGGEAR